MNRSTNNFSLNSQQGLKPKQTQQPAGSEWKPLAGEAWLLKRTPARDETPAKQKDALRPFYSDFVFIHEIASSAACSSSLGLFTFFSSPLEVTFVLMGSLGNSHIPVKQQKKPKSAG